LFCQGFDNGVGFIGVCNQLEASLHCIETNPESPPDPPQHQQAIKQPCIFEKAQFYHSSGPHEARQKFPSLLEALWSSSQAHMAGMPVFLVDYSLFNAPDELRVGFDETQAAAWRWKVRKLVPAVKASSSPPSFSAVQESGSGSVFMPISVFEVCQASGLESSWSCWARPGG
jgi:hypothetical protein